MSTQVPTPVVRPLVTVQATPPSGPVTADLGRLIEENAELKAQLEEARTSLAEHDSTLKQATAQLEELRRPMVADILSSTLRAELKSGEVVVTGGYPLSDGRRLYAFAKPTIQAVDGVNEVLIEGRYFTLTDEVSKSVGLDNLATNAANTLQHGEVWVPGEEEAVLSKLQAAPGADMLICPKLFVQPGRSGTISVGDIQLKVTPSLVENGDSLGLELRLEQPQQSTAAGK
jgi:hypothetical protein